VFSQGIHELFGIAVSGIRIDLSARADAASDDLTERGLAIRGEPNDGSYFIEMKQCRVRCGHDHHFVAKESSGNGCTAGDVLLIHFVWPETSNLSSVSIRLGTGRSISRILSIESALVLLSANFPASERHGFENPLIDKRWLFVQFQVFERRIANGLLFFRVVLIHFVLWLLRNLLQIGLMELRSAHSGATRCTSVIHQWRKVDVGSFGLRADIIDYDPARALIC
jgi:hypothetical protein